MPTVTINPNNSGSIKLGTAPTLKEFACQVTNWILEPAPNMKDRAGTYCGPPTSVPGLSSWKLSFDFLQDWGTLDGLSEFTADNDGVLVDFEFFPTVAAVPKAAGKVWVTATAYGGAPGESWASTGEWSVEGTPTFTAQALLAADETAAPAETVAA
jgi:hypothetical protein